MGIGGELQTVVFTGKDCRVTYQNRASRVFHGRSDIGNRTVRLRAGDWDRSDARPSVAGRIVLRNRQDNPALGTSDHRQLVLCADL
jgi:hypothetical protein